MEIVRYPGELERKRASGGEEELESFGQSFDNLTCSDSRFLVSDISCPCVNTRFPAKECLSLCLSAMNFTGPLAGSASGFSSQNLQDSAGCASLDSAGRASAKLSKFLNVAEPQVPRSL